MLYSLFLECLFIVGAVSTATLQLSLVFCFEAGWYAGNVYGRNGANKQSPRYGEFLRNLDNRFHLVLPETRHLPDLCAIQPGLLSNNFPLHA